jgi:hypothetical protein
MEIKKYHDWLFEKQNPISECGCASHSFITESISIDQVMANHEANAIQPIDEAGETFGPFVAGKGGNSKDILCLYGSGYYSVDHTTKPKVGEPKTFKNSDRFKETLDNMIAFLKAEPAKTWVSKVIIKSSESIIPNFDMEGGTGQKATGWLSEKRKEKIAAYVSDVLKPLFQAGTISKLPEARLIFEEAKTLTEPSGGWDDYRTWMREADPVKKAAMAINLEYTRLKKGYDADQKTTVQFIVVQDAGIGQCALGMKIYVNYDDTTIGHSCDHANFEITVNGIPLKTSYGGKTESGYIPAGLPFASMSNSKGPTDELYKVYSGAVNGGVRRNVFRLDDAALVKKIASAGDGKTLVVRARCIKNGDGYSVPKGLACHTDAPHVWIYGSDGNITKGFPTYPKTDNGELAKTDLCGNNLGVQNTAVPKSADAKGAVTTATGPTLTGVKVAFAANKVGTLNSDQALQNYLTNGTVAKQKDNTYLVNKVFTINNVQYNKGDVINKILPKGTVIAQPAVPNS